MWASNLGILSKWKIVGGGPLEIHPHLLNCLIKVPQVQFGSFVDGFLQLNNNANTFNSNTQMVIDDFYSSFQKPYANSNNYPTTYTLTIQNSNHKPFQKIQMFCIPLHPI
jgi:hypothetical protein